MAIVKVLVEGYVREGGARVQGTVTLVKDEERNIVVDPGMTSSPDDITSALKESGLTPEDIDIVFITHHHPDHTRFMGLFKSAKIVDFGSIYDGDKWLDSDGKLSANASVFATPGHTPEDATLIVSNVTNLQEGSVIVAICHLWWFGGMEEDPTAKDFAQLQESRKKVLELADYVVPGHGPMFKVNRG